MTEDRLDVDALRQWADFQLPADRDRWPALMNQVRSDMEAAVAYIDEIELELGRVVA